MECVIWNGNIFGGIAEINVGGYNDEYLILKATTLQPSSWHVHVSQWNYEANYIELTFYNRA